MKRVGVVGAGIMGRPMALNLLRAGYPVSIFARSSGKVAGLTESGATLCSSLKELATFSDVVLLVLPQTEDVREVLFGAEGLREFLQPSSVVIDASTIAPEASIEFSLRISQQDNFMLDAPVSGGEKGASAGTLGIMVGGLRAVFEEHRDIFEAIGKVITYCGPSGCGLKMKLVNQLMGAANLVGVVEGLRVASEAGLDLQSTLDVISSGAAGSWMLQNLGPLILKKDFKPGFSIRLQSKDLGLLTDWIRSFEDDFPSAQLSHNLFSRAVEHGLAEQGNQGLINIWNHER